jgi:hypothetical protein
MAVYFVVVILFISWKRIATFLTHFLNLISQTLSPDLCSGKAEYYIYLRPL